MSDQESYDNDEYEPSYSETVSQIIPVDLSYSNYYSSTKLTKPFLTKYEQAKILGIRSEMISNGALALVNIPPNMTSSYEIALEEFKYKKIPLMIKRTLPNGSYELWRLDDLTY